MHLKYNFQMMDLHNQTVAVPIDESADGFHGVIKLNKTAAFVFNLLKEDITEEAIVDAMMSKYEGSREQMEADVKTYIAEFEERGLLA